MDAKNAGQGTARRRQVLIGVTAATLGRAFARGERTHDAMLARGFSGRLPLLHATAWSVTAAVQLALLVTVAAAVAVLATVG